MTKVLGYEAYLETESMEAVESIHDKAMREVGKIICEKCDIDFTYDCDDTGYFEEIGNRIICGECYEKEEEELELKCSECKEDKKKCDECGLCCDPSAHHRCCECEEEEEDLMVLWIWNYVKIVGTVNTNVVVHLLSSNPILCGV